METLPLILASASPRRKTLLKGLGLSFDVVASNVDEGILPNEAPKEHTMRLARKKAGSTGRSLKNGLVIGADTVVVIEGRILGKPADTDQAKEMLRLIAGRTHSVITAFCVLNVKTDESICRAVESRVTIKELSERDIEEYLARDESMDKAGAYAVQGKGKKLVERVEGSYSNVVGLPIDEVKDALEGFGIICK